jgi:peptidoglycan-associated lipoprotein
MKNKANLFIIFCIALSLVAFSVGCGGTKNVKQETTPVVDTSADDEAKARAALKAAQEKAAKEAAEKAAKEKAAKEAAEKAAKEAAEKAAREKAEAAAAAERLLQENLKAFESENIYFDYDLADLKPEAQTILEKKAKFLTDNTSYSIRIEGNCDERGTNEYNIALGDRRADAAKKFLNSLGISAERISTISYGEEKPVDTGHDESAWSQNRRDEFKIVR